MLLIKRNTICLVRIDARVCLRDNGAAYSDLSGKAYDCTGNVGRDECGDASMNIARIRG